MWRLLIRLFLLLGFFIGSVIGIIAYRTIGYYGLIISVAICVMMMKFKIANAFTSNIN